MSNITIAQLTSMKSASGKLVKDGLVINGVLTIKTEHGDIEMTVAQWDAMYRAQVNCWPAVRPLKEKVIVAQRELAAEVKKDEKKKRDAEKLAAKKKAADDRKAAAKAKSKAKAGKGKSNAKAKSKSKAKTSGGLVPPGKDTTPAAEQESTQAAAA